MSSLAVVWVPVDREYSRTLREQLVDFAVESATGTPFRDCYQLVRLPGGGPALRDPASGRPAGVGVSLSRCNLCSVAAAGSQCRVGIDVELAPTFDLTPELLAMALTTNERQWLGGLPADRRPQAFATIWTRKEAVLKACGTGLAVSPNRVEVGIGVTGNWSTVVLPDGGRWQVMSLQPIQLACLSVACDRRMPVGEPLRLSVWALRGESAA